MSEIKELVLRIDSKIIESNLEDFTKQVKSKISEVNTDLKTDEDFALAEQQVKDFKAAEAAIKDARDAALSEAADVRKLLDTTDDLAKLLAETRLNLEKQVKAKKAALKDEAVESVRSVLKKTLDNADERIRPALRKAIPITEIDAALAEAVKGKKGIAGIETACDKTLRIWMDTIDSQEAALIKRYESIPQVRMHLFADLSDVLIVDSGFDEIVKERIAAEDARIAEEKARIEAEAKARAEAEAEQPQQEPQCTFSPRPVQQETAQEQAQGEGMGDYKILLHCSLDKAKALAMLIKETNEPAFVKLKKGH